MNITRVHEEYLRAMDIIANGKMQLSQIAREGLMRKEFWILFAGATYPPGTYRQRADKAVSMLESRKADFWTSRDDRK